MTGRPFDCRRRRRYRLLAGTILVGVTSLALAACGGDDPPAATAARPEPSTTTSAPTPAPTTTVGTTSTTSASGPTTTRVRGTATTRPAAPATTAPRVLSPPAPGLYRYDTTGSSALGSTVVPFPAVTTLAVDAPSGTTQHSLRNLKDANGMGTTTDYVLDYRADGVYLVSGTVRVDVASVGNSVPLRPPAPVLFIPVGAGPGTHVEADVPTDPGSPVLKLVIDVLRQEAVTVAGRAVDTLVVRGVVNLPPGAVSGTQETTVWFDPVSRLVVKESSKTDVSGFGGLFHLVSNQESLIQRLTPA